MNDTTDSTMQEITPPAALETSSGNAATEQETVTSALPDVETAEEPEHDIEIEVSAYHYENLSKEELYNTAAEAVKSDNLREASDKLKAIRQQYENLCREERQKAHAAFIEAEGESDGEKVEFQMPVDPLREKFFQLFDALKKRKEEHRQQIEKQKLENLQAKKVIIEKLKALVDGEESNESLDQLKNLQNEWKKIKTIPQEHAENLWQSYNFLIDRFYDNRSKFYELKELDRNKNLEAKIELCRLVGELQQESNMRQCMTLLNKYHEDWKNIGPVPKDFSEDLWQRFKLASDQVHERYKKFRADQDAVQTENLQKKREIFSKAQELAAKPIEKGKEWNDRAREYEALLNEWRSVGMVPREYNNLWEQFRGIIDEFYKQKNNHFKELNKVRMENYRKKEALCIKAEALKESTEWGKTSKELIRLQDEWKAVGPVPDKYNEPIWKRFRAACDAFFNAKNEKFAVQKSEYATNLEKKTAICDKLESLITSEDYASLMNEVKAQQEAWNATGFVAPNVKDELYKRYNTVLDKLYDRLRKHSSEFEQAQSKQRFEFLASQQDGKFKLQSEARRLQERIHTLQENIDTLQNNIGFFAHSKNADSLRKKVEEDVSGYQKQIKKLKEQLQVLRGLQNATGGSK